MSARPARVRAMEKDQWQTPPWLLAQIEERIGPWQLDVAALSSTATADYYMGPDCDRFSRQDALGAQWAASDPGIVRAFCNPPFSGGVGRGAGEGLLPWIVKANYEMVAYGLETVLVAPANVGTRWWRGAAKTCTLRWLPDERVPFHRDGELGQHRPAFGLAILLWSPHKDRWLADMERGTIRDWPTRPRRTFLTMEQAAASIQAESFEDVAEAIRAGRFRSWRWGAIYRLEPVPWNEQ